LLPKIGNEEIRYRGTQDRASEVFPICRSEKILGEFVSMGKFAIDCPLILNVRKKTDRCNINLDKTELSLLVEQLSTKAMGFPARL
jgi:hypothetical protein